MYLIYLNYLIGLDVEPEKEEQQRLSEVSSTNGDVPANGT